MKKKRKRKTWSGWKEISSKVLHVLPVLEQPKVDKGRSKSRGLRRTYDSNNQAHCSWWSVLKRFRDLVEVKKGRHVEKERRSLLKY
jgi:hypothetical protein